MPEWAWFQTDLPGFFAVAATLLGLLVGSFLNVVIHRLPIMLEQAWRAHCEPADTWAGPENDTPDPPCNLLWPGSHCPACHRPIPPHENIPLLSYLLLRGRCAGCGQRIAARYPAVELLTALVTLLVYLRFGYSLETLAALILSFALIALAFIDLEHQLLPDAITLPMIWLGLLQSLFPVFTDSHASIVGAVSGYLTLWLVFQLFRLVTGKDGMGFGDFKLLALLGAWLGAAMLPQIVLWSSLAGASVGLTLLALKRLKPGAPIPMARSWPSRAG